MPPSVIMQLMKVTVKETPTSELRSQLQQDFFSDAPNDQIEKAGIIRSAG